VTAPPATVSAGRLAGRPAPANPLVRLGRAARGLLTSVRFAVVQITAIATGAVIGMVVPQLPGIAFRSPADYAEQMDALRARLEPSLGAPLVSLFERLGFFAVFSSWWLTGLLVLLTISIVVCTLDRAPGLWREVAPVRVVQPDLYYAPTLPGRAVIADGLAAAEVRAALRAARFRVREEIDAGHRYLYGDRNRWAKLATLATHAGLVGFLLAAAATGRLGFEKGLLLPAGQAIPLDAIGTEGLINVKALAFEAPRDAAGRFLDFVTTLAVYRDGREVARKDIRVNDPLAAEGYTFHQNFFGPAAELTIRDGGGRLLWSGPVPLDEVNAGRPYGRFSIPGREIGLELLLDRGADGQAPLLVLLGYRPVGTNPDGSPAYDSAFVGGLEPGRSYATPAGDLEISLDRIGAFTGIIVKRDPGAPVAWASFVLLAVGLSLTFYFPRRRVWARLDERSGELRLVGRADREVAWERELARLVDDLVARRRAGADGPAAAAAPPAGAAGGHPGPGPVAAPPAG